MAINFQHPIYNCNLAQEQYDSGFFSINAYRHVITRYAQCGVLIYCEISGSVFYPDYFEYTLYNNKYKFHFTDKLGHSAYPITVYLVSYRPRTITFPSGGSYTLNNSERKLIINGYNFYYNDTNLADNFPNHFISICFEEWYYENLTTAQYSSSYSVSRFPIIKYFMGTTTYYMINNGNTISSQIPTDATNVAVLSGSGNSFLKSENNWLQVRNLQKITDSSSYTNYVNISKYSNIDQGYKLQSDNLQVMNPFSGTYAQNKSTLKNKTYNRVNDPKEDIYEPSNAPDISDPRILYNSFFANRPNIELTRENFQSNVYWIDNYLLYCCGDLIAIPSDWKLGVYFAYPTAEPTITWDYSYTASLSLAFGSSVSIRLVLGNNGQLCTTSNTVDTYIVDKTNSLLNKSFDVASKQYNIIIYTPNGYSNGDQAGTGESIIASAYGFLDTNNRTCIFKNTYTYPAYLTAPNYGSYYIDPQETQATKVRSNYGDLTIYGTYNGDFFAGYQTEAAVSLSWKSPLLNGIYTAKTYSRDAAQDPRTQKDDWYYYGHDEAVNGGWQARYYAGHEINLSNQWEEACCIILYKGEDSSSSGGNTGGGGTVTPIEHE